MKKSSFIAMILGTISIILFAIGMCMVLITEWEITNIGIVLGCASLLLAFITLVIWRKMEHKDPIHISLKNIINAFTLILGVFGLGIGMCFSMVWERFVTGTVIGITGILILLCLIPLTKGIKDQPNTK